MNLKNPCVLILVGLTTLAATSDVRAVLTNVAYNTAATESSDPFGFPASLAVDGNESTFQHTANSYEEWWKTDLGKLYLIDSITIVPRPANLDRINGAVLSLSGLSVYTQTIAIVGSSITYTMPSNTYGRIVQIQFPYTSGLQYLNFCEIYVYSDGTSLNWTNLALAGAATQSTTLNDDTASWGPAIAIDGSTVGNGAGHVTHTQGGDSEWWRVDLGSVKAVEVIRLWNRDSSMERLSDLDVQVLGANGATVAYDYYSAHTNTYLNPNNVLGGPLYIEVDLSGFGGCQGQYVKIIRNSPDPDYLSLAEVQVYGYQPPLTGTIMTFR